uniref:Dystonin n=1 Tax=Cairina moschata TaxID=8855 RepID=A0A8C3D0G6_CAIMO
MSSSADFSDEEDSSHKSGTVSPAPGDTLPWNLPKHERSKRKIQGGSVLDPAERAVLRIADERDKVQKKTFTKWINQHLMKVRKHVNDLYEDLRDGHNLISLLEVLSGDTLRDFLKTLRLVSSTEACAYEQHEDVEDEDKGVGPREKGRMRFHRLQNVQIALDYLKKRQVKLVNIRNDDITDGNPKLTLGLIWTIILHFQISDIHVTGESEDMSAKERLLLWSQQTTEGYAGIRCENFTTCWRDGRLFNAIIHKYRPDLIDMNTVAVQSNLANLEHAFFVAEKLGVARLLDPEDVDVSSPDEKSVITYVSSLYDAFPKVPEGGEGIGANDVEVKWVEYQNMVNYLMQWIRHHVTIMSDRTFPNNPVELKALYNQYLQFKETEIPPKEIDKSKIKRLYKLLEVWIEFGRIKLPQGYHPNDIEKEWGKLIIAMLEREKTLRPEVESLFLFDLAAGLNGFLLFIQDTKRLESGLQFQHEAEIAGYLLESENLLRQQVIDAQILIDGKYYQADQLVLTSGLSSGLTSRLTPAITPAYTPGIPPRLIQSYVTGVDSGTLQTLKLMQIRKPLMKSAFVDQNLTEEEVNMKFVQDLLNWVEEMQVQLDRAEWGSDLPSVESHLENHKNVHKAIEEFESSLKEAKMSEIQMTAPLKLNYAEKLHKLESQYSKLLNTSRNQERHLDTLHNFVSRATRELIWLNEKEEEEVAYDWSERNPNITRKKEYHAELMRELDQKEEVIKSVQEIAEQLLLENHPARLTIEAYRAAMQTQWSWILQLCHCVEQHLKENAAYFEFFSDAKEAMEYLKNLKDAIYRKYSCDRTSSLHRLEDLVQESMEEKEQLLQYKSTVAGLVGRAKAIIQLKPRNPDCILKTSIPIKAICDYRQIEITIYKDDECVLANNSHRAKWKVISPSGNEAMVPSVCFTVPPPNKEAIDTANRIEQQFQNVLALWHESHVNMKSVVSWHYLTNEIEIKTMLPGEHQQVLSNLQSRFDDFVEDSQESKIFTSADTAQLEREVNICKQYYQELLKSAEREEQEESIYNLYISEVRNIRLRLESCEERLIRQIRTPMERDDLHESVFRISEQEKELDRLKDDLGGITDKCEEFFSQAAGSPSVPTLRSELNIVIQNMNQVYSMSSIYIDKLKTVNLVLKNTQGAESLVKLYETKLCEEEAVTADKNNIENLMGTLKQWRSEVDEKREVFHALEDELQKAKMISDQMFKMHKERDLDFDWHKEKVDQLAERWQNIHSQIENRLRDLESINKSLKYYKDTYNSLDTWIQQVEDTQRKIQEIHPENSKALAKQLNQHKMLVSEIEMKQSKIDECQKYAEQYSAAVKDYELQTMTYRAMVDSQQKSPVKRRRMQSSSDFIIQEFMDLRTRYTALVTLMTQYIKFAGDSLKRLEEEEVGHLLKDNQTKRTAKQMKSNLSAGNIHKVSIEKEYQHEIQILKNELAKSNHVSETLKRKIEDLNKWNTETKLLMKQIQSESEKMTLEKQSIQRKNEALKSLADGFKEQLRTTNEQLHKQTIMEQEFLCKIKSLEDDLAKTKDLASEYKQKCDKQSASTLTIDLEIKNLNAQMSTGFIIDPTTGQKFSVDDSVGTGLADNEFKSRLHEAEKAVLGYCCSGKVLSVYQAMEARLLERQKGKNILEAQIASGGVIDPVRSVRVPPETAVQLGLLNIKTGESTCFDSDGNSFLLLTDLKTGVQFNIEETLNQGRIDRAVVNKYKEDLKSPIAGFWLSETNERIPVLKASRKNLVDRVTALRCLEAQVSTGGIIDPYTGKKYSVSEALQRELIDDGCAKQIQQCELIFTGIIHPVRNTVMSAVEAMSVNALDKEMGMRCLEYQYLTGGLIDPKSHSRLTIEDAIKSGVIDAVTATKMKDEKLYVKVITCPKTKKKLTYKEALERAVFDCHTGLRLLEAAQPMKTGISKVLSVFQSVLKGFIDYDTGVRLLENQLILTGIISPESGVCYDLEEAKARALIDEQTLLQLQELKNAKKLISESSLANLPVVSALEQGLISEPLAIKILENQLSSGHLILPSTGEHLTLQSAFQRNLISPTLYAKLLEKDTYKDLIDPNCAEKISLEQMVHRSIIHEETGLRLLPVKPQEKGRITFKCGRKITILRAAHEGLIDRETMFRLLGAQMMSGGIIDPDSGKRLTVEEAMKQGMIDQDTACGILTHQVQAGGILCPNSGQRLTVDEAVQCNLISSTSALLVLEAQRGFVGLIWPHTGEIFPISTSLHQEMITNELAFKILNDRQKIAALYIPETCEVLGLDQAAQSGLIDINTVSVLNSVILPDKMPSVEELESPCKNAAKWLSTYELLPSVFHDCEEEHEDSGTQDPVCRNTDQAKKLFISYLMVNSYMDANTGRRLLLYDGQLQEAISMLLGGGSSAYNIDENEFSNKYISPKGINQKSADDVHFSNVAGNVQGDLSGVESTSNDRKLIQFGDLGNDKCLQGKDLHVCTSDVCNTSGTEQSEYAQEMLVTKSPELRNVESSTQNSTDRNVLKGLLEDSEWTQVELCKHNDQKANSGNIEGFILNDSNPNLFSETGKEDILLADSLCKENINDKTLQKALTVTDLSDNKIWRDMERCMQYEPHILEADSFIMVLDNAKKDDFQRSFGSSISADTEYRLPEESESRCGHTLQLEDNGYSEQPLLDSTDVHNRASLEDHPHGRPSLEGCTDLPHKLCLKDGRDIQWTPLLESNTVTHDGPSVGDSNSTAQSLAIEEGDLPFDRLLPGSSSDSSLEGSDSIPQFESNHLEHEYGEIASEGDSSLFDDDDDAYETPQVDDDDSDVYGSPQIDDDESYDTPQGDDDFDTLQLRDVDTPEPENVPLGKEEGSGLIALGEEISSFQELPTSAGESGHYLKDVNLIGLPDSINTASESAETLETVLEEERERIGGFGEKQKLPVTLESEGRKEECLASLLNLYETNVQRDRNEEDEMKAESTSSEDESEGTQEEDYDYDCIDYDSYDDSDTDSDKLGCTKTQLESTAFDVQFFISEHAQDLSPNQSKQLLRLLNTTQKSFQEVQEAITSQVESLETQLKAAQELGDQKVCLSEIQKDMRASAQTLAEIVKNTETFLKENGEKLSQEDKTILEQKLNEAKTKCLLLSQKAEESKKELDKAMTTAIKQETEKVAAIEQLEESKNTIENLLDWLSNVDKEAEYGRKFKQAIEQNGTHFEEGDMKVLEGEEDDVNGNLLEIEQDIESQAQHEKIISQQQAVIIATQSAQALLEKQGHYLSPEEKEKMQRNMKELKAQYETALAESERKMKMTHSLREELEKFDTDYSEFETWLQQAEQELDNLEAGASDFSGIMVKLKRQKSFSEDVISHKGDLRYITISGQRVLDAARSCSKRDGVKVDKDGIDTSATYAEVQNKLDSASDRFKSLYTKVIKSLVWLKETLKCIFSLSDDIVERYDNLSKSVNERNEKLQITLTRSLSVQDGLDEMLDWMEGVEKSLEEKDQVPLNSAAIQDIISKKQDIAGRQSSINTMNEKVKKFMETADPSTASSLQAKMSELAGRFSAASKKHKEKLMKMEELKTKVELFEGLTEKLQSFLDEKNQALSETEAPRKDVSEVSQYMQEASVELAQHKKDLEVLQQLLEELSFHALPGDKALVVEKVNALSKKFREVEETVKEKEEDVSSCQKEMDAFELLVESLKKWIKETTERIPAAQPSLNTEELKKPLEDTLNLKDEWTLKATEVQKMNSRGTLLCNLITAVTSPAKLRAVAKSGMHSYKLTTVQQAMSDVNHSYEDLGVLLKEKISELESMLSKMQNIQEESASMMQWLQKMDKTASDWEAAPTDSEAVKAQVEQHKLFETELKQSANKVQELKDKVTELLEKNPDSPEAPKWRQTLDKIELNQVTSERQQKLEESSNYLIQFQTAEAQLKHWLVEKELMVSVLGPLSIDPNMLNTQKQQVQILLKEFDTRKPQYEQLTMAGEGILKRPGEHPPSHEAVKEQLAAVAQKWDNLTGQLSNRCDRIDQAIVKSTEYQSLLRSLSDKLSALDSKLSSSLAVSTQPDAVKQQLEIAKEMKEEIEREMKNINAARALCEELSALVGEEYLKAELTRHEIQLPLLCYLLFSVDNHVQQLQSAYATSHQFQQMSKDFQAWLDKKKEELNQARPVSAKLETLQSLIEEQKDFKKTLNNEIGSYEKIVAEGESILQKTQGADKAALQSQIATLRSNWDEMDKQVKERQDKLTDCLEKALKYKQHVENLQPWIEKCQSNLSELKVGINPAEIENSVVQVRAWQKDLDKHHGMVELLNNTAESLLSASETDKEIVREETKALNQKVNTVTEQLHKKRECLENMAQRLKEFQESSKETEKQLKSAKEHLEAHDSLGPQSFSNKHLTMMQAQQKALETLKPHVDLVKKLAQDLVVEASDSAGVSDLLLQAESLEQEYNAVNQQVEDRCSFLETKLQGIGHFQNSIREMFSQFAEFDDELDSMAPVGRDLEVLQSQREDIKSFLKKLEDLIMNNENANKNCKMMLATEAEASPDLVGIKRDLEALNKQCNKLLDRAKAREDQVEGTISRVEEFYSKLKEFSSLLGRAEEHEESQGPVGMETETINQQLDTFKVFQKEEIEPLQVKQQEVNWLGQGLIQSAAKSTNTENLEHDLEDVNTRWKTLNKKVAQRAAQLQEALLHCGRFQDALESLLSWLIDTEELVANQKPPSAEFKVVKAQIQEQKLLQRLLDDRKPTVEVIKREGEKIAESAEPADKVKILKQLSFLDSRWDALLSKAETRNRQLEGISVVAQQFHEALEPLVEWLTATEKRLANAEPIGTQASKLQQQIAQHKALEDDVLAHNKSLHQAISIGQSLKTMSSREDKDMVQEKLDSSQARYIEIQEKSNSRSELLQQAYCNAQIFGEDEVELMNWLNEVHDKLSKLSVQDCNAELIEKQHSELLDLQEEILLRKQNVDLAIQNGLELLKQTTGDEVVIIQDKLEGIKARYKDITKLSSDVSKTLEQALQLAGQLHSTHEELCKWLDKVEVELLSYETQIPKGEELSQAQERQKELKKEAKNNKALVDTLNEVGSAFLELVPWRAREGLDKMITEDNERYRLVSDTISQKVDEIDAAILRSQQFDQAADAELAWIGETEKKLMSLGDIRLEQDQTAAQLQVQKAFTMEILRHKDTIDELVKSGDKIMNTCTEEEKQTIKKKLESLLQKYDTVCQMNSERNLQLERAQSLVNQFWETYEELWPWLTETEMIISQLPAPALEYETLKQQQEEHRQLRELIAEHKPHIDKMNKTGPQLLELSPGEGFSIQEKYVAADTLYSKIKEDVKKRALALDEAISQCTQFHDKIDPTLESLKRIVERLRQPPSISAEVEKIKEQISENKNVSMDLEKLQPVYETLKQRGEEMIARSEGADKDISAKAVQDKLDQMVLIWQDIQTLTEEREAKLLDVMELAEKFWCDHMALVATIKDTQDFIRELEGPGVDPSVVKQQQEAAEAVKEEIDGLQEELETVVSLGSELRAACGEPDKPIVNKSIDELNSAWDALNKTWKERVDKLAEAMQAAVQYQDGLQAIFDWVDIAGIKLASMSPVGTDLETVKQQTEELKQFKTEAYQQQIEMERLNHQAELLLKKVTQESDKHTVQDPLSELKLMWDSLEEKIINRQHKLEGALLALGQFQHALDELLTWLTHTEDLLNEQKPVGGDPKAIEIELAKHHVLQNDVLAHQSTVEAVKKAGSDLIESSAVEEASNLRSKLELLNQRWQNVLEKTEQRKQQLDSALIQAQGFHGEVEDMQQWLTDTERQLLASKPVGGLPETAREQLNTHMELCAAFEAKEETYKCLMQKGQQMLARCPESAETNVEQDINNLKEKWESVQTKLSERKTKLEEALNLAMEFHNSLQDFINWLTQAEQTLTAASRPSLILDTVLFQIDEHKVFATEVNSHRDQIIELDKTGTHLKYFSQKQDVVLIKNLLISVQSRWEKVVQRLVERGRALDDARKRAKQFHEAWHKLMEWLEESEKSLDSDLEIANDPDKIKMQLAQHKEFQKSLGAKHSVYDTTNRTGRSLKEKTTLADDNLKLDDMLSELRDKWDTICGKSVERQNKLEEALLFSGQFTDALQALIDWLYKIEPQLAEDQPVHGDIDLVMNLIDNHKVFQKELGKRTSSVQALKRSARELIEGSRDDSSWVKVQMQELSTRWETVCALSVSKQTRLEQALRQAEEFHSVVHVLLEWLAEAEQALRFHGVLPDDEEALRTLIDQHREFMKKLEEKKAELNKATGMGEAILAICHPDSITTIKHWITIIRARFEEVLAWAKQHQQRLAGALAGLIANQELLEALLSWLQWAETTLTEKDKEVIPQEIEEVKALIAEHQTFMEEMTRKQPDVDKVTKTYKRKALEPTPVQSHIPVLDKGRAGRKRSPTPGIYPSAAQAQIETKNPRVNLLVSKWQQVWLLALERRRKLNDALDRLEELREFANFDFDIWRKKYMRWMNHKKSRVMDFFRRIDKDQDGKITRQEFIDGILSSKFPTSRLEMSAVADTFDRDGDGYIDYYEFVAALHPNKDAYKPLTDADKIEDEVTRQVAKCKCAKRFQVEQIGDNKYRVSLFGDSQQLRLVRILRSTVMVRVGGGWMALDEFLVKNDPCRVHHHGSKMLRSESNSSITTQPTIAKGRTNVELREKFILADGASQSMAAFRPRGRRSRPSSRGASPNRSTSLSSQAGQAAVPQAVATSTPKTPHHLTRNYGKPWLTNSKTSTPSKPAESSDYQGSSAEVQRTPSRPGSRAGSKAGSRSSSRRGSDASDFDISEIQSVCSDMSETVPPTSRPTPRAGSRPGSAKPSKIPTPQRRPLAKF